MKISPIRKRALEWLQSCETSTPTVEEVIKLICAVGGEYYAEGLRVREGANIKLTTTENCVKLEE